MRYRGKIAASLPRPNLGFITLVSVTTEDGSPSGLTTQVDIFVHQENCTGHLIPGVDVTFVLGPDDRRGNGALRAFDVMVPSRELVLVGADGRELAIADPKSLYVSPTPRQQLAKFVPAEDIEVVVRNEPMPLVSRTTQAGQSITKDEILSRAFPQLYTLSQEANADFVDESFDAVLGEMIESHRAMGLTKQAEYMLNQSSAFQHLRTMVSGIEDLLTPGSMLPIQYLPDLFMAVPVWYFWGDNKLQQDSQQISQAKDPHVHDNLAYFCDLFPNQRWIDTFLMFNRRIRTLSDYRGDMIPPRIIQRMHDRAQHFDYLTIMTPYHDVAGKDWDNVEWLRSIDPYVVGFIKGLPMMFVLGRFSDSGVFPLHSELVADTINFLSTNKGKLSGFDRVMSPYWYDAPGEHSCVGNLGSRLIGNTNRLIQAFEAGHLFDWLRGSDQKLPTPT